MEMQCMASCSQFITKKMPIVYRCDNTKNRKFYLFENNKK